jgi:N-methylhydantoinase B/oxoprolinase/acetone carboxylase alpha subunit
VGSRWGHEIERDPERVLRDVLEEKLTPEYARREYGVAIEVEAREILPEESAQLHAAAGRLRHT